MALQYPIPQSLNQMYAGKQDLLSELLGKIFDPNKQTKPPTFSGMQTPPQGLPELMAGMIIPNNAQEALQSGIMGMGPSPAAMIQKIPSLKLYHGTTDAIADKIMQEGFKIPRNATFGRFFGPGSYLAPDPKYARFFGPSVIEAELENPLLYKTTFREFEKNRDWIAENVLNNLLDPKTARDILVKDIIKKYNPDAFFFDSPGASEYVTYNLNKLKPLKIMKNIIE